MRQVNPNKASKENTTILCFNMLKQRMILQRHIKQSQLFITSHATANNTKQKSQNNIKHGKTKHSHSQKQALFTT